MSKGFFLKLLQLPNGLQHFVEPSWLHVCNDLGPRILVSHGWSNDRFSCALDLHRRVSIRLLPSS